MKPKYEKVAKKATDSYERIGERFSALAYHAGCTYEKLSKQSLGDAINDITAPKKRKKLKA